MIFIISRAYFFWNVTADQKKANAKFTPSFVSLYFGTGLDRFIRIPGNSSAKACFAVLHYPCSPLLNSSAIRATPDSIRSSATLETFNFMIFSG